MQLVKLVCGALLTGIFAFQAHAASGQIGFGYGQEFHGNTDLRQYELTWRQPLQWEKTVAGTMPLSIGLEVGAALIDESGDKESPTFRLTLIPMAMLEAHTNLCLFAGLGLGIMEGETAFTQHNLGGPFFLNSKLGVKILLGNRLGLEYAFYHQSNAGIYDYNAGLNMHHLAISWSF
jgi:hypothetical protein